MDDAHDYFTLLGLDIDDDVDEAELKAAYRKAARDSHPDSGGSDERFRAVQDAYETLRDPDQARMYRAEIVLREIRKRMTRGYVPASDYVPYIVSQVDPVGRYTRAGGTGRSEAPGDSTGPDETDAAHHDADADGPAHGTDEDAWDEYLHPDPTPSDGDDDWLHSWWSQAIDEAFDLDTRPWDGDEDDTEARSRLKAAASATQDVRRRIKVERATRIRRLKTPPLLARIVGGIVGVLLAALAVAGWDSGLIPQLLGVAPGDTISFMREYDPDFVHGYDGRFGWQLAGAVGGWQLTRVLLRIRRRYRVDDRLLLAVAAGVAGVGFALPAILGSWVASLVTAAGFAGLAAGWAWLRQRGGRAYDTDQARSLGLHVTAAGGNLRVELDQDLVAQILDETIAEYQQRRARQPQW